MEPTQIWLRDDALQAARDAAAAAEAVIAHYYRKGFDVERKSDATPVTIADREAELEIKRVLKARYPDHAYYGEEFGREGTSPYLWLIDPAKRTLEAYSLSADGAWGEPLRLQDSDRARIVPFDAIELALGVLWAD